MPQHTNMQYVQANDLIGTVCFPVKNLAFAHGWNFRSVKYSYFLTPVNATLVLDIAYCTNL
jgi:hypothetical protein